MIRRERVSYHFKWRDFEDEWFPRSLQGDRKLVDMMCKTSGDKSRENVDGVTVREGLLGR